MSPLATHPRDLMAWLNMPGTIVACGVADCMAISFFPGTCKEYADKKARAWFKEHREKYHGIKETKE